MLELSLASWRTKQVSMAGDQGRNATAVSAHNEKGTRLPLYSDGRTKEFMRERESDNDTGGKDVDHTTGKKKSENNRKGRGSSGSKGIDYERRLKVKPR